MDVPSVVGRRSRRDRGRGLLVGSGVALGIGAALTTLTWLSRTGYHGGLYTWVLALPFLFVGTISGIIGYGFRREWPNWWIVVVISALLGGLARWLGTI